jgi:phosphate transport system permease protein
VNRVEANPPQANAQAWSRRASSLFARGEPMIWLSGGALSLCILMIVGLLILVFFRGMATFWPQEVVEIRTVDGRTLVGEVTNDGIYTPGEEVLAALGEERRQEVEAKLAATDGESYRRLVRTGNFDLNGSHFNWVSDFEVANESRPEWSVVIERLSWGRFYGVPKEFRIDGEVVAEGPEASWKAFEEHHGDVRERWHEEHSIQKDDLGKLKHRRESARLDRKKAELADGIDSEEYREADEEFQRVVDETEAEGRALQARVEEIRKENGRYRLVLDHANPNKPPKELALDEIVRAYPANSLGAFERVGVYVSRWWEYLWDDPREANAEGGVWPAIFGTVVMTMIMTILVVPFGVLAALYLREYAKQGFLVSVVRIAVNNLAGVPSIVFGVFGLGFFCYIVGASIDELFFSASLAEGNPTYGKSGLLWASLTLALLTLPVVIVATEEALAAVPRSMREGSYACGASKWQTIRRIVLPRATPGIMTGMILAIARGAGEVAPLMLVGAVKWAEELPIDGTAPYLHPERSFMHLGFHIYDLGFQSQNSEAAKPMVFTTTLLLIAIVVLLNILAIWIRARLRRAYHA